MTARVRRPVALLAAVLLMVLVAGVAAGCSTTLGDLPLPGTGVSGDTITIDAEFAEALNLSKGATVKVNGVDSGRVQQVAVDDFHAKATMIVRTNAELRQGATARLRYTTPLGELFVDVTNPAQGALLTDGDSLTLADTDTAPTVEDALSEASLLVNGGGLSQLQTITEELNKTLGGREDTVRSLLERSRTFLTQANATTTDIDQALHALDDVSVTLGDRQHLIDRALKEIRPAAKVLRDNTPGLTRLLHEVATFSASANDTVTKTRTQLLDIVRQAGPVLAEFAGNQSTYPASLDGLVKLSHTIARVAPGDYVNISLALHLDKFSIGALDGLLDQLGIRLPGLPSGLREPAVGGRLARDGDRLTLSSIVGGAR